MNETSDVVIIGGGVMGSATAFFLRSAPGFTGTVTVVERDPTYTYASSARSASSIRQQFSTPLNIQLSLFGIGFLRRIQDHLAVDGEALSIGLREPGYLILSGPETLDILHRNVATQRAHGANTTVLTPDDIAARFPWIRTDGIAGGGFGLTGEGTFDGPALMQAFRRKAAALGTRYVHGEVVGIEHDGRRAAAVRLADGTRIAGGTIVLAAGPQSGDVAALAGIPLPVRPRKRTVFFFKSPAKLPGLPLLIDINGVWVRHEGDGFVCGVAPAEHDDFDAAPGDFEMDHHFFDDPVWPTIAARVPAFETLKVQGGWAGYYEVNTLDHNAIIGPHPDIANLLFVTGFSGHGIQQSPAAGRAISELILHGRYTTIDCSLFGYERVRDNRPVRELNVI
ncbi:MAG: FAD-binding oxidoreductase [Phreatobacter sp.]|uniref:NAD(P)/FAD-dependent oxidoreductase n=1 Tax=Phreatobacter sp. TaxID=1966341 RepID=UPI001A61BF24|nr:FAD-binding oxidoreductase [Phreatobacter sp.]MBL8571821.1 FAD-binding oxidoreductase [Phreatobacter sp.]